MNQILRRGQRRRGLMRLWGWMKESLWRGYPWGFSKLSLPVKRYRKQGYRVKGEVSSCMLGKNQTQSEHFFQNPSCRASLEATSLWRQGSDGQKDGDLLGMQNTLGLGVRPSTCIWTSPSREWGWTSGYVRGVVVISISKIQMFLNGFR